MMSWRNAKSHISGLTIAEKRRLYKCRDRFKTLNDIVDWGKYVWTDECRSRLASYWAAKKSRKMDEARSGLSLISAKNEKMETVDADSYKAVDIPTTSGDTAKMEQEIVSETVDAIEAVDKSTTPEDNVKMQVSGAGDGKLADKPTTSGTTVTDEPKAVGKSVTSEDTEKMEAAGAGGSKDDDKPTTGDAGKIGRTSKAASTDKRESGHSSGASRAAPSDTEKKFPRNDVLNGKISLFTGDITCLEIDAIVNAANEELYCGGGVDNAIHSAAGYAFLRAECDELNGCDTGDAKITSGYKLPAKHVIHAVGTRGEYPTLLRNCYNRAMDLMKEHELETIAFPCISTGIYGYPNRNAANVALETIRKWLDEDEYSDKVKRVIFCLFLETDIKIYHELMPKYFPFE